jgi:hypothetical protein
MPGQFGSSNQLVDQAVQFALATSILPKDSAVEGLKSDLRKDKALARIQQYESFKASARDAHAAKLKTLKDPQAITDATNDHDKRIERWDACIDAEQKVLLSQ